MSPCKSTLNFKCLDTKYKYSKVSAKVPSTSSVFDPSSTSCIAEIKLEKHHCPSKLMWSRPLLVAEYDIQYLQCLNMIPSTYSVWIWYPVPSTLAASKWENGIRSTKQVKLNWKINYFLLTHFWVTNVSVPWSILITLSSKDNLSHQPLLIVCVLQLAPLRFAWSLLLLGPVETPSTSIIDRWTHSCTAINPTRRLGDSCWVEMLCQLKMTSQVRSASLLIF